MKIFNLPSTITATELSLNALLIAMGVITLSPEGGTIATNKLSGDENFTLLGVDSKPELTIKDYKSPTPNIGTLVIGLCTLAIIKDEFEDWEIYPSISKTGTAANLLFKGRLKASKTEVYDPAFLSFDNVMFKTI
jgi:hypothetical protein